MILFSSLPLQVYCQLYPASVPARTAKHSIDREVPSSYVRLRPSTHTNKLTWGTTLWV